MASYRRRRNFAVLRRRFRILSSAWRRSSSFERDYRSQTLVLARRRRRTHTTFLNSLHQPEFMAALINAAAVIICILWPRSGECIGWRKDENRRDISVNKRLPCDYLRLCISSRIRIHVYFSPRLCCATGGWWCFVASTLLRGLVNSHILQLLVEIISH